MDGVRKNLLFALALAAAGCSSPPDIPFRDWLADAKTARASEGSSAFDALARAAESAEREAGRYGTRVWFSPPQKTALISKLEPSLRSVEGACRGRVSMEGRAQKPFEALPYQNGWRLMGHAMAWKIERAAAMDQPGVASREALSAIRLGLALTGGSATDASLGYSIVNEACEALAPAVPQLGPSELRSLGTGIEAALRNRPSTNVLVSCERVAMLQAVQAVQDAYRDRKLGALEEELGRDVQPAIDHLRKLESKGPERRAEYFLGFAEEAEIWAAHYETAFKRNVRQREGMAEPRLREERPWRRLSRHFFRALEPLLSVRDEALCRLRLLGLSALLLAECKANDSAPGSLVGLSQDLKTDPYSGEDLLYRPDGGRFLLYSVGEDLKDDGGETDEEFTAPDMRLAETS